MVQTRAMITPSKRARTSGTRSMGTQTDRVIFAGKRSETKRYEASISHVAATYSTTTVNAIIQGSAISERSGNKIKILRIDGSIRSTQDESLRVTIYSPKDPSATLAANFSGPVNLNDYWVIKDFWLHAGTVPCNRGNFFSCKLPMGINAEYAGAAAAAATDFRKNKVVMRIQSANTDTVSGYVRCWYIDP